jgi:hypothetical protein
VSSLDRDLVMAIGAGEVAVGSDRIATPGAIYGGFACMMVTTRYNGDMLNPCWQGK